MDLDLGFIYEDLWNAYYNEEKIKFMTNFGFTKARVIKICETETLKDFPISYDKYKDDFFSSAMSGMEKED